MRHIAQTAPNGIWPPTWDTLDTPSANPANGNPVVALNGDGRLEVLIRHANGALFDLPQRADGTFPSAWTQLETGASLRGKPSIEQNTDGSLDAVYTVLNGKVAHVAQLGANGTWGSHEVLAETVMSSDPAVGRNADGKLEAFVRGPDQGLWHLKQITPGVWR